MGLINQAWNETIAAIAERRGLYALLALGLIVPPVLHAGWLLATVAPGTRPSAPGSAGFSLLTTLVALWAQLAIVAAGVGAGGGDAARVGLKRLLPAFGIELLLGILVGLLLLPLLAVLVKSGVDLQAMPTSDSAATLTGTDVGVVILSIVAFLLVAAIAGARLVLIMPVIALERRGLGAIARSWRLTRGLTWRIIGVVILFVIVIGVAVLAAQSVAGLAAALVGGTGNGAPAFAAAVAGAVVTAALSVVAIVFTARLWRALDALRPA